MMTNMICCVCSPRCSDPIIGIMTSTAFLRTPGSVSWRITLMIGMCVLSCSGSSFASTSRPSLRTEANLSLKVAATTCMISSVYMPSSVGSIFANTLKACRRTLASVSFRMTCIICTLWVQSRPAGNASSTLKASWRTCQCAAFTMSSMICSTDHCLPSTSGSSPCKDSLRRASCSNMHASVSMVFSMCWLCARRSGKCRSSPSLSSSRRT